jgi:LPS export ABC transporter protein LptC
VAKWQRQARLVLAIIAIGVIGVVAYTMRPRQIATPPEKVTRSDPNAIIEVQKGDAIQLKGEKQNIRVEYERQTVNKDNETTLHDVTIHVDNRGGRSYIVKGQQAFLAQGNAAYDVRGAVTLTTDDGLEASTERATYTDVEHIVRAPGPVTFKRGRMSGSGVGFAYDEQRDVMSILANADVKFAKEADQEAMAFTAGSFNYARRDRYMNFAETMHMEREGQIIDADNAMVRLFPDRDEPDYLELRNGSRVTGSGANSALKSMAARDINLDYADDGRTLQNATLAGKGEIQLASAGSSATQILAGDYMDIGLEPDGSVRSLAMRDAVSVTLPASKDLPARTIRSSGLTAAGNAQGLRDMKFTEGVEYREPGAKGQQGRVVKATTLEAVLDPAAGTLHNAHFMGSVDFTDSPMHATSSDARYDLLKGTLALSGTPEPHIDSDALTIDAVTVDVTLDPRSMIAKGNVRSVLLPSKKGGDLKRPALLAEKDPVSVISESLTYDETARRADYVGKTVLMQGDTTIRADSITVDEGKGDLTAKGSVVTNLVIIGKESEPGTKTKPTIARAEAFSYSDQTRVATYTTKAQLDGEQGNLSAGKLELQLAKTENALEKLEANGAVTALVDRRTVTGTRLTYSTGDDKYVVMGAPVKMIDAECQETSGKTLTFWKASDRVQVDGNNEVRTQTKGGGKCPATPPR